MVVTNLEILENFVNLKISWKIQTKLGNSLKQILISIMIAKKLEGEKNQLSGSIYA